MRRRLAFLSTLIALVMVLVLPATAFGSTYEYRVQDDQCSASGGDHDYGHLSFRVKLTEYGKSGANKFTFTGKVQHRNIGETRWYTDWNSGTFAYKFANTSGNTWYSRWWEYHPDDFAWHRIKVTLKVWHDGVLLAKKTLVGASC